jgi:hypothetical protein
LGKHRLRHWNPLIDSIGLSFADGRSRFYIRIHGSSGMEVLVEGAETVNSISWQPIQTLMLTDGSSEFNTPLLQGSRARFFRMNIPR